MHERVVVIDTSKDRDEPRVLINPEITKFSEGFVEGEEGCLSVPQTLRQGAAPCPGDGARALGRDGQPYELMPTACWPCSTSWTTCWARFSSST